MKFVEESFRESGANVADCFVSLRVCVVGCEKEGTIYRGTFTTSIVGTQDYQVQGITKSGEIVFLNLYEDVSEFNRANANTE